MQGFHDTNSARRKITETYIVHCDEVFAIANIGRAASDAGVKAVIDLAHNTGRKHVGIVCTKSEVGSSFIDLIVVDTGRTLTLKKPNEVSLVQSLCAVKL